MAWKSAETDPARRLLSAHLADPTSGFSIGACGAIAEFLRGPEEPLLQQAANRLSLVTARGGLSIGRASVLQLLAYETLSKRNRGWQQAVAVCLPAATGAMHRRNLLTELDADSAALRAPDRRAILFDLGVGAAAVDFCIRTEDPELLGLLRRFCGRPLFAPGTPVLSALKRAAPHRVVVSRLGRIEVFQTIGKGQTPEGPHTHLMPELIAGGRSHSANAPIPEGLVPALMLYPAHPLYDQQGEEKPFAADQHAAFQALLQTWGLREYVAEKQRATRAFRDGCALEDYDPPRSRLARTALRIALRQLHWTGSEDGRLASWCAAFDRSDES